MAIFGLQTDFNEPGLGRAGERASLREGKAVSRVYAKRTHAVNIALGGNDAGTYSFTIETAAGVLPSLPVTISTTADPLTADQMLTALAAAISGHQDLRAAVRATADLVGDNLVIEAKRSGEAFTVVLVGNPSSNMVLTTTTEAAQSSIPYGVAIAEVDHETARLPTAGTVQHTITATPRDTNLPVYGFSFGWRGQHYSPIFSADGSTTVAQACDGIVAALGAIDGLTITDGGTEVTIATHAGGQLDYFRESVQDEDVPDSTVTLVQTVAAVPGDTEATIRGILAVGKRYELDDGVQYEAVPPGDTLYIAVEDDRFVMPEVDMAIGDQVWVRTIATGSEQLGAIRNDSDGGDAVRMTRWRVGRAGGPTTNQPIRLELHR